MKNLTHTLLLVVLLLISSFSASGKDIRILAIGNSFSEDAVEQYLYELAAEGGDNLIIGNAYRGGQGLQSHWDVVVNNRADFEYRKVVNGKKTNSNQKTLLQCIVDEEWDYITFQQVSQDSGILSTYEPWLSRLLAYVKGHAKNPDVKFGMHRTWAYAKNSTHGGFANYGKDQQAMYEAIVNAVNEIVEKHDDFSIIVPTGTAIQNARGSFIGDNFCRDGYHLTYGLGRYTAACTWLEIFTGQNPVDKTYRPASVSEVEALIARHAAHYAVLHPDKITPMENIGYEADNTIEPGSPVKINFGDASSLSEWNDINASSRCIFGLKDSSGNDTEIVTILDDDFNGTNTEGVQNTTTPLNLPNPISSTCLWGYNKGSFGGSEHQPTGGFLFSHLNKKLVYDFYIFGSRKNMSDNRETEYLLEGENRKRGNLNTANNGNKIALVKGIQPTRDGEIRLTVSPGKNNTNGNQFYYINALQIVARQFEDGDFDDDEKDPMLEIDKGKKYYIRHTKTGLYLQMKEDSDRRSDFCLNRLTSGNTTFEYSFQTVTDGKPIYNIGVNSKYLNAGEDGKCIAGPKTDIENGQVKLELEPDHSTFKMRALWNRNPNYINLKEMVIGADLFTDRTEGALWKLEIAKTGTGMSNSEASGIRVYPTLSKGSVTISTSKEVTIKIADCSGRILDQYRTDGTLTLELNYVNGPYLILIDDGVAVTCKKVILHR